MKIILTILAAVLLSGCLSPDPRWRTSLAEAQAEAADAGLPLVLVLATPECSACEYSWYNVFSEEEFTEASAGRWIPVYLTCPFENLEGECAVAREFQGGKRSPSILIFGSDGSQIADLHYPFGPCRECVERIQKAIKESEK